MNFTTPFLPPIDLYTEKIATIWQDNCLTNNGPLVQQLEQEVADYLEISNVSYVSNGTIALQVAIKALNVTGDVITTPFSYVATSSALVWQNCKPIFIDIDPETFNIRPDKIASAITSNTSAILVTHVFGNPAEVSQLEKVARDHGISLIFDAAHCFGVRVHGKSIFEFGHISTLSTHATKVFHTIEGGFIVTKSEEIRRSISLMRNFGHDGPGKFSGVGINGKNSEFHAAMGLCNIGFVDTILGKRKKQFLHYQSLLEASNSLSFQILHPEVEYNFSYFPIVFKTNRQLLITEDRLVKEQIAAKRYFYPSLNTLDYINYQSCPVSEDIASRILCLPLSHDMSDHDIEFVSKIVLQSLT